MKQYSLNKKPIVHIGYHKTGSTFFQKNIYPFVYDAQYIDRHQARRAICSPNAFDFCPARAQNILAAETHQRIIICEEELSGNLHIGGCRSFLSKAYAERIKATFDDAYIVILIRNQFDILISSYVEYIKDGGTLSLKKYLSCKNSVRRACFCLDHFNYFKLIEYYISLFGQKNVKIYLFEHFFSDLINSLNWMQNDLDIQFPIEKVNVKSANKSYKKNTLSLLKISNLFTSRYLLHKYYIFHFSPLHRLLCSQKLIQSVEKFSTKKMTRKVLLKQKFSEEIDFFREGNRRLQKKHMLPLEQYGYPL